MDVTNISSNTHVVCTNLMTFGPLVCVSRPYTFWGTRAPFAIFHLLKKWMTSKGLGSQKQSRWWSSSKHPESLRSIHITENNPCIHVSHKLLPQTTTPPPTTQPYSSSPPELCDTSRCSLSLDLRHMLPDSRIAAEGPHCSSFSAPSIVSHCSFGSMPFVFSRVKSSLWNMALWNIHFKSHERNALKCTFNCVLFFLMPLW